MLHRVLFHDISFDFAQNSWNIFKNEAHMVTMETCLFAAGLLSVFTDQGPSHCALKPTAAPAGRPHCPQAAARHWQSTAGILR